MLRALHNELRLEWSVIALGTLLVSVGGGRFVRFAHPLTGTPTAYLPGSALKGLLRAACAGIIESAGLRACAPDAPCSELPEVREARTPAAAYRAHCATCQIFGSHALRGRFIASDAYPAEPLDELHMHDLANGEVCECASGDAFHGTLALQNFERWQLGLIGSAMAQINAGHLLIGANRSQGMGRAAVRFNALVLTYFGFYPESTWRLLAERVNGLGSLTPRAEEYGLANPDIASESDLPPGSRFESGFGFARVLSGDHTMIDQLFFRQLPAWETYIQTRRA